MLGKLTVMCMLYGITVLSAVNLMAFLLHQKNSQMSLFFNSILPSASMMLWVYCVSVIIYQPIEEVNKLTHSYSEAELRSLTNGEAREGKQ